jgi:hypothetical protein
MRLSVLAAATLGAALFATAATAAVTPPRTPRPTTSSWTYVSACASELGLLRTVHKNDVMAVDFDNTIIIRPVCQDSHLDGNAVTLTGVIGRNEAMSMALEEANFRSDDVVGIHFGDNGAVLLFVMQ